MLCKPVRHDKTLESEFALEELVERAVVLARPRLVDQVCPPTRASAFVSKERKRRREEEGKGGEREEGGRTVTAHDARDPSHDRAHEWMKVDFMLCTVIHVRRLLCPEMLLLAITHDLISI